MYNSNREKLDVGGLGQRGGRKDSRRAYLQLPINFTIGFDSAGSSTNRLNAEDTNHHLLRKACSTGQQCCFNKEGHSPNSAINKIPLLVPPHPLSTINQNEDTGGVMPRSGFLVEKNVPQIVLDAGVHSPLNVLADVAKSVSILQANQQQEAEVVRGGNCVSEDDLSWKDNGRTMMYSNAFGLALADEHQRHINRNMSFSFLVATHQQFPAYSYNQQPHQQQVRRGDEKQELFHAMSPQHDASAITSPLIIPSMSCDGHQGFSCHNPNSLIANYACHPNHFHAITATATPMMNVAPSPLYSTAFVPQQKQQEIASEHDIEKKGIDIAGNEGWQMSRNFQSTIQQESSLSSKKELQPVSNFRNTDHTNSSSDEKPRRPLNAYNFFFSEEREFIVAEVQFALNLEREKESQMRENKQETSKIPVICASTSEVIGKTLQSPPVLPESQLNELREKVQSKTQQLLDTRTEKERGENKGGDHRWMNGIGFRPLSKAIARRWKNLPLEKKAYFKNLAKIDSDRYISDMNVYAEKVLNAKRKYITCQK